MTCKICNMFGGYTYNYGSSRTLHGGGKHRHVKNKSRKHNRNRTKSRSRSRSLGLSLAVGRTYSGGFSGFPNGYSTGGELNPMLSSLANPSPVVPYNTCV